MNIEEKIEKINSYLPSLYLDKSKMNSLNLITNEEIKKFYIEKCNGVKVTKRELFNIYPYLFQKISTKDIDNQILASLDKIDFLKII